MDLILCCKFLFCRGSWAELWLKHNLNTLWE